MSNFTAQINDWVGETNERIEAVFKKSTERTIEMMQRPVAKGGNMPVDTGFLRNSLQTSLNSPILAVLENPGIPVAYDGQGITLTILGAEVGDTIYAVYGANYAGFVEYGANGRPGRAFVRQAAAKWKSTVSQTALELQQRVSRK